MDTCEYVVFLSRGVAYPYQGQFFFLGGGGGQRIIELLIHCYVRKFSFALLPPPSFLNHEFQKSYRSGPEEK